MYPHRSPARRDLLLLALPLGALLLLSYRFDIAAGVRWPGWLVPWTATELLLGALYMLAAGAIFTRWRLREQRRGLAALRAAEAAARESTARLWLVVSRAPVVLFALDSTGIVMFVEGRGLVAAGYRPADLVGRSVLDLFADTPQTLVLARRALAGEEFAATVEMGGAAYDTQHVALRDARGTVTEVIGVATEVTARYRAEAALRVCEMHRAREQARWRRHQFRLTDQEARVLDLLAADRNTLEIATTLHIQPKTISTHIHHIGRKLGLAGARVGRGAVMAAAREQGLLAPSPAQADACSDCPEGKSTPS